MVLPFLQVIGSVLTRKQTIKSKQGEQESIKPKIESLGQIVVKAIRFISLRTHRNIFRTVNSSSDSKFRNMKNFK